MKGRHGATFLHGPGHCRASFSAADRWLQAGCDVTPSKLTLLTACIIAVALDSAALPSLEAIGRHMIIGHHPKLVSVQLPVLQTIIGAVDNWGHAKHCDIELVRNAALQEFRLPQLRKAPTVSVWRNVNLQILDLPALTSMNEIHVEDFFLGGGVLCAGLGLSSFDVFVVVVTA